MSTGTSQRPAETGDRALRADAVRNRERIIEVARALFAERGLEVPMATIARRSGVGVATLYRRFPTKESLIATVFADEFTACVSIVDEALADPDPWHGFRVFLESVCAMQAADRGFSTAFVAASPVGDEMVRERDRAIRGFAELTRRAQECGRLRADFVPDDLFLLLGANSGIIAAGLETPEATSRRLVAYLLDAVSADGARPSRPLPPPVPVRLPEVLCQARPAG